MKISLNWINDFVDLKDIEIAELIKRLTLGTAEVEGVECKGREIKNVVVGKVLSVEEKPELKTTRLVQVDVGDKILQTLCGAKNVRVGMLVATACPGGSIVGLDQIDARKVGDYESNCILCSERELGISDDHSGLIELPLDLKLGEDIKKIYRLEDCVIEIDNKSLTNRPDLWGHYGIAREIAAIFKRTLKKLELDELKHNAELVHLDIKVKDKRCNRYSALTVRNIKQKTSSVDMKIRLYYTGLRSISLLVDLTNYVMLELGQPMHAFDKRTMHAVVVDSLKEDIKFTTLDDVERIVPKDTLMIQNGKESVAIAGIMGGQNTEIKEDTAELLIESAAFDAGTIRKTAVKLKLRTDASSRFEKSLDPELTVLSIKRFIRLLKNRQEDIEVSSNLTDVYVNEQKPITIEIDKRDIDSYMGVSLSDDFIIDSLTRLEFDIHCANHLYIVKVPTFRATKDISMKADIIEEVARMYGYDHIVPEPINLPVVPLEYSPDKMVIDKVKEILTEKYGATELHSYIWHDNELLRELEIEGKSGVSIVNSEDGYNARLREDFASTLFKVAAINAKHLDQFTTYEVGSVFKLGSEQKICEQRKVALLLFSKTRGIEELFYDAKDMVQTITHVLKNKKIKLEKLNEAEQYVNKTYSAVVKLDEKELGKIMAITDVMAKKIAPKAKLLFCELDLDTLIFAERSEVKYVEPSIYQQTKLDFNFLVTKDTRSDNIIKYIYDFRSELLKRVELIDLYKGKGIDDDKKSMTFGITIGSNEKTLVAEEINAFMKEFIEYMKENHYHLR